MNTTETIAAAIANARGARRGVPEVANVLEILPAHLRQEVLDDARAVEAALARAAAPPAPPERRVDPYAVNGQASLNGVEFWRIDDLSEGRSGIDFLNRPAALVRDDEALAEALADAMNRYRRGEGGGR